MKKAVKIAILLICFQFIASYYLYPILPENVAIHWNIHGEADGYSSKHVGVYLIPVMEAVLIPVFLLLPRIDPKNNKEKMIESYSWVILAFTIYMAYVHGLFIGWNLGYQYDLMRMLVPMLGALFYGLGAIIGRVEMNWFMGIRTPWTLSSEEVWNDTHRLGGKLFKICGAIAFSGVLFSGWTALALTLLPILASSIYLIIYSYLRFKQLQSNN